MTDTGQTKDSGVPWTAVLVGLALSLIRDLLSSWLIKPFSLGLAMLIVFPLAFPFEERKVTLARWLCFTVLVAVLFPGVIYGTPYLLCGYERGAVIYGLLVSVFALAMRFIWWGLHGEPRASFRNWALASVCVGITAGILFYYFPGVFCDEVQQSSVPGGLYSRHAIRG